MSQVLMRSPLARDRRQPPGFIRPALPVLATKVPASDGWLHELKHDGFRIVAHKDGDEVRLCSRNGRNWSADFLAITTAFWPSQSRGSRWTARRLSAGPRGTRDRETRLWRAAVSLCRASPSQARYDPAPVRGRWTFISPAR